MAQTVRGDWVFRKWKGNFMIFMYLLADRNSLYYLKFFSHFQIVLPFGYCEYLVDNKKK